jgi:hypothetical protein
MANHENGYEQFKFWLLAWVGISEYLVVILSFGFIVPDWHAKILFSDWMDSESLKNAKRKFNHKA